MHEVEIECEALSIPDKLEVNVNDLLIGGHISASDLVLPSGVVLVSDADIVLVHCVEARAEEDTLGAAAGTVEPEVIGRKAEDEETEE